MSLKHKTNITASSERMESQRRWEEENKHECLGRQKVQQDPQASAGHQGGSASLLGKDKIQCCPHMSATVRVGPEGDARCKGQPSSAVAQHKHMNNEAREESTPAVLRRSSPNSSVLLQMLWPSLHKSYLVMFIILEMKMENASKNHWSNNTVS